MRYISDDDVAGVLDFSETADTIRAAFLALAAGRVSVQGRVRTAGTIGKLSTVGAVLDDVGIAGAKVYTTSPSGQFRFAVVLFDPADGVWLAALDGAQLTRIRTAATSLIVADALANPRSSTLAIFGSGVQAEGHALAFAARFPLDTIVVCHYRDATPFVEHLRTTLGGIEVRQAGPTLAIRDADLVVTATRSKTPLFDPQTLKPDAHVTSVGATLPEAAELDARLIGAAELIVVDSLEQARRESGNLMLGSLDHGESAWDNVVELADLLTDPAMSERARHHLTVFDSLGVGLEDIAAAALAHLRLNEQES